MQEVLERRPAIHEALDFIVWGIAFALGGVLLFYGCAVAFTWPRGTPVVDYIDFIPLVTPFPIVLFLRKRLLLLGTLLLSISSGLPLLGALVLFTKGSDDLP